MWRRLAVLVHIAWCVNDVQARPWIEVNKYHMVYVTSVEGVPGVDKGRI